MSTHAVMQLLSPIISVFAVTATAQYSLFNGAQSTFFSSASTQCLSALNATLNCAQQVQLLGYDLAYLNWGQNDFNALCTSSCVSSLQQLESSVSSACGNYTVNFNAGAVSVAQVIDYYHWKLQLSCLQDTTTGQFCELEMQAWNIAQLSTSGQATWPQFTNKTYPNWYLNDDGSPLLDYDGSIIPDPFEPDQTFTPALNGTQYANVKDFYVNASAYASNYGLDPAGPQYDSDELPLQYQCSSCFVNRYIMGYQSTWGLIFDEVAIQVWGNMRQNCNLTQSLAPAYNMSAGGRQTSLGSIIWSTTNCPYNITVAPNTTYTCGQVGQQNSVESASIGALNLVNCNQVANGTLCSSQKCTTATVPSPMSMTQFLAQGNYSNITLTQLMAWNPNSNPISVQSGDTLCIGAPGGNYIPPSTTVAQAYPTVFTTTATPAASTAPGSIANCGKYYLVQSGDYCNSIALNNSITFQALVNLNPKINCNCTNLFLGYDYCVAPVNNTNVTPVSCTTGSATPTTTTPATSCTSYSPPPTQTVSGTTSHCCTWYTTQSGDSCYSIEQAYGITLAQFRAWNTYIDSACDNLYVNYSYCVYSSDPVSSSSSSSASTSASSTTSATKTSSTTSSTQTTSTSSSTTAASTCTSYVAAPTQTVSGTTSHCCTWYTVKSGDSCYTIDQTYGISLNQFRSWNTYVDAACDNLYVNYAYCVSSSDPIAASIASTAASSTTTSK